MKRLVVIDLEATCWRESDHPALAANQSNECEIIEIGAVAEGRPAFRAVVRPRRHPTLSSFCTELTGLTQADVDSGVSFPEALAAFLDWSGGDDALVLASWGAFDDRQLRRDAQRHQLAAPRWEVLNIKRTFARYARQHGASRGGWMGLGRALEWVGLQFEGTPHRAVDDARNAARVLDWLRQEGHYASG